MPDRQSNGTHLKRVSIKGLHGSIDLDVHLQSGLNIIHGQNGTGKTTFLHILANLTEADIERFTYIRFDRIVVETVAGNVVSLERLHGADKPSVALSLDGERLEPFLRDQLTPPPLRAIIKSQLGGRPVYLPAFRMVLEAVSKNRQERYVAERSQVELNRVREREFQHFEKPESEGDAPPVATYWMRERAEATAFKTVLCREWFGAFVPTVRFPSLADVADELGSEFQTAELTLAQQDRAGFSEVFVDVVRTVFDRSPASAADTGPLLQSIREHLEALQEVTGDVPVVYNALADIMRNEAQSAPHSQEAIASRILKVYDGALRNRIRAQELAFKRLRTFETSVNRFIQSKRLVNDRGTLRRPIVRVQLDDGRRTGLSALSSGERHVLTLLFSATHMGASDGVLLIDEPELSLHVDWQRIILSELMNQAGNRQIIACTHAPEVAGDHRDRMVKLEPTRHRPPQGDLFPPAS